MLFKFSDIHKSYGEHPVLRGISFQINPSEKVGLVGRNGAGKTTAFRILTGQESPDSGVVEKIKGLNIGLLDQHVDFSQDESVHTAALSSFKKLHDMESRMRNLELQMAESASEEVLAEYAKLQSDFELEGGFECTARAEAILLGLGFSRDDWDLSTGKLSGGQKNRLGMARLLLSDANLLLLDEPTNHLDVTAVEWLENFLMGYEKAYVVISHDRYFLDRTCTRIVEVENGKSYSYKGNYSHYANESEIQKEQRKREFENQQAFVKKTEAFIRKNLAGQKTKQAKSRRNMLERMDRLERVGVDDRGGKFDLDRVVRTGANVLTVENMSIGYADLELASGIDFLIHRGDRLGIIGGNGTGKTTFLKTILGEIAPLSGTYSWGTKVNLGYYSQELEDLEPTFDLIDEMREIDPLAESGGLRSFLARFLFFGEDVFKKIGDLSGGERGRLALAKLIYSKANVLVLDEPTNHLDIPSREALEAALKDYSGTILTVSHDRFFLDLIATQIFSFEGSGAIEIYNGNYSEFHRWKENRDVSETAETRPDKETSSAKAPQLKEKEKNRTKLSKNEHRKIEARIAEIEISIRDAEEQQKQMASRMNDKEVIADQQKLNDIGREYESNEKRVQDLYIEWDRLSEMI